MSKSGKNLIIILGIITTVFAAYYFFTQEAALVLRTSESDQQLTELLQAAETFAARERVLNTITLETRIFESDVFTALRDFSPEPDEFEVGRSNPFAPTSETATEPTQP